MSIGHRYGKVLFEASRRNCSARPTDCLFTDDIRQSQGGPRREFPRLVMANLRNTSDIFEGPVNAKTLSISAKG